MQKISAIQKVNSEIIARVEARAQDAETTVRLRYAAPRSLEDGLFVLIEKRDTIPGTPSTRSSVLLSLPLNQTRLIHRFCRPASRTLKFSLVATIVKLWQFRGTFITDIWDVFNDKPDWKAKTWDDLKRLNVELLGIVRKFGLLDKENKEAITELAKYMNNLEVIQTGLGEAEALTLSEPSRKDTLEAAVTKINDTLLSFYEEMEEEDVSLALPAFAGTGILNRGNVATLVDWFGSKWSLALVRQGDGLKCKDVTEKWCAASESIVVIETTSGLVLGVYLGAPWPTNQGPAIAFGAYDRRDQQVKAFIFILEGGESVKPTRFHHVGALSSLARLTDSTFYLGHRDHRWDFGLHLLPDSGDVTMPTKVSIGMPVVFSDHTGGGIGRLFGFAAGKTSKAAGIKKIALFTPVYV